MVYTNTLTAAQKDKKLPRIIARDGDVCFYDKMPFVESIPGLKRTYDHANNNPSDNREENLLLAHFECNLKKKNNPEMQVLAIEALKNNVTDASKSLYVRESERDNNEEPLTEGQVNAIINKLVKSELETLLPENSEKKIPYNKTLRAITYLVIEQTGGRGSETAVRRSLDAHCSTYAPWDKDNDGRGTRKIWRRQK